MNGGAPRSPVLLMCAAVGGALVSLAMALSVIGEGIGPLCGPACLEGRLAKLQDADGTLPPARREEARRLIGAQLGYSPFNTGAWLQLAALELAANGGRLEGRAATAVEASYRFAPINAEVALWRTRLVFNHWREASEEIRLAAQREVQLLARQDLEPFVKLQASIQDPSGSLAYRFLLGTGDDD